MLHALILGQYVARQPFTVVLGNPTLTQVTRGAPQISPTLRTLVSRLQTGGTPVVNDFWNEVAKVGTPLIEPVPEKPGYSFVTFLWKGDAATRNVLVVWLDQVQLNDRRFLERGTMSKLVGSDIWFRTYVLRNDTRVSYRISPNDSLNLLMNVKSEDQAKRLSTLAPDPLNPRQYLSRNGPASVLELPAARPRTWTVPRPGVAEGRVTESTIGSNILGNERKIWIYTPPGYESAKSCDLLVTFDGETFLDKEAGIGLTTILDNLHAAHRIQPTVAVMVGNAPNSRLKDLWYSDKFNAFLREELVPWVRKGFRVSKAPRRATVAGLSLGGGASLYAAFKLPNVFGNVISQSGGNMYPRTREEMFPDVVEGQVFMGSGFGEFEWLTREMARTPKAEVKVYLEAGLLEDLQAQDEFPRFAYPSLVLATRHLRDVLQAKGYKLFYNEFNGHHETLSWRETFGDALIKLRGT